MSSFTMRSLCIAAVVAGAAAFAPQPAGLARPGQALATRRHCVTMLAGEPAVLPPAELPGLEQRGGAAEVRGRYATPGRVVSEDAQGTALRIDPGRTSYRGDRACCSLPPRRGTRADTPRPHRASLM